MKIVDFCLGLRTITGSGELYLRHIRRAVFLPLLRRGQACGGVFFRGCDLWKRAMLNVKKMVRLPSYQQALEERGSYQNY